MDLIVDGPYVDKSKFTVQVHPKNCGSISNSICIEINTGSFMLIIVALQVDILFLEHMFSLFQQQTKLL